jgi:DNA-binding CsgD family transcriptional regulator
MGRAGELERLDAALDATARGEQVAIAIAGEPGIGKSALLAQLGDGARARGFSICATRASESGDEVPYQVLARALALDLPAEETRMRLLDALEQQLSERTAATPLLLAVDDLHWADAGTLAALAALLQRGRLPRLLLAVATRPLADGAPAQAVLDRVQETLRPGPLSPADVARLLPRATPARHAALHRETGGNPFYLHELTRAGATTEPVADLPAAIAAAVARELQALDPDARLLAHGAAIAGDPFEPELAAAAAALNRDAADAALDRLGRAGLLRSGGGRRVAFRHPIVRRAVLAGCGPGERRRGHARIDAALAAAGAAPERRAPHVAIAAQRGDAEAVAVLTAAGERALRRAPAVAIRWLALALELLGDAGRAAAGAPLALLTEAQRNAGRLADCGATADAALAVLGPEQAALRIRVVATAAHAERIDGRHAAARVRLERELEAQGSRAELHAQLATHGLYTGEFAFAREQAAAALADARAREDTALEASALGLLACALGTLDDLDGARLHRDAARLRVARLTDDELSDHVETLLWLGVSEFAMLGDVRAARETLARGAGIARRVGPEAIAVPTIASLAHVTAVAGDLSAATGSARAALDVARLAGHPLLVLAALTIDAWRLAAAGETAAALDRVEELLRLRGEAVEDSLTAVIGWTAGPALLDAGAPRRCLELVAPATAPERLALMHPQTRCFLLDVHVSAAVAVGELETAQRQLEALEQLAYARTPLGAAVAGCAAALVALATDRPANADALATTAAEHARRAPSRLLEARAALLAGRAQASLGAPEVATERFAEAEAIARGAGARTLAQEAARHRRELIRAAAAQAGAEPSGDDAAAGLTTRQLEIARLVAAGRTNREVAVALGISEHTVNTHLRAAFRRLGVTRRAALASALERRAPSV